MGYRKGGLEPNKYTIQKTSGKSMDPSAHYFVLRYDTDPHARIALRSYAVSIGHENNKLSLDIIRALGDTMEAFTEHHRAYARNEDIEKMKGGEKK